MSERAEVFCRGEHRAGVRNFRTRQLPAGGADNPDVRFASGIDVELRPAAFAVARPVRAVPDAELRHRGQKAMKVLKLTRAPKDDPGMLRLLADLGLVELPTGGTEGVTSFERRNREPEACS